MSAILYPYVCVCECLCWRGWLSISKLAKPQMVLIVVVQSAKCAVDFVCLVWLRRQGRMQYIQEKNGPEYQTPNRSHCCYQCHPNAFTVPTHLHTNTLSRNHTRTHTHILHYTHIHTQLHTSPKSHTKCSHTFTAKQITSQNTPNTCIRNVIVVLSTQKKMV